MCDLADTEEEAEQKFNDWIKTYYWPEEWDEPANNNSGNSKPVPSKESEQRQSLEELKEKKKLLQQELDAVINDGNIEVRNRQIELSEQIQKMAKEIEKNGGDISDK